jgi:pyridoxal phosphate enzyme (YggS family)
MTAIDRSRIAENLERVRARIAEAAERAGRSAADVRLVGVSKTFPASAVVAAVRAGLSDVGENRVQEAAAKQPEVAAAGAQPLWHLIGHLQTNKAGQALELFSLIHSVDSLRLAEALSRRAMRPLGILLEVNVAAEATKSGFSPDAVSAAAGRIATLPNLDLCGLMTVAPLVADAEEVRPIFRRLRGLRDALGLRELSMGMSADYAVAIEEGATIVRVGRAIFGERG